MFTEADLGALLVQMEGVLPYTYAQFIVEDAERQYSVFAERITRGSAGYAVAHRTGVIGQVFRRGRAIIVTDTRDHPLYDPYDTTVDWEVTIPLFSGLALAAVLNFEGCGTIAMQPDRWSGIARLVREAAHCEIPTSPPDAQSCSLVPTARASVDDESSLVEEARYYASLGKWALMVGLRTGQTGRVTPQDVELGRVPLAECVRGVEARIDELALDSASFDRLGGWQLVDGRYDVVVVKE